MSLYLGTTPIADGASTALLSEKANVELDNLSNGLSNTICTTKATTTSSASSATPAVIKQNYVNGTSWYRVWSDGWIEQGGIMNANNGNPATNLLKSFSNTDYTVQATMLQENTFGYVTIRARTTTSFQMWGLNYGQGGGSYTMCWYACGY